MSTLVSHAITTVMHKVCRDMVPAWDYQRVPSVNWNVSFVQAAADRKQTACAEKGVKLSKGAILTRK